MQVLLFVLRRYHRYRRASSHDRRLRRRVFFATFGTSSQTVSVKTARMRSSSPLCFWELSTVPLPILGPN